MSHAAYEIGDSSGWTAATSHEVCKRAYELRFNAWNPRPGSLGSGAPRFPTLASAIDELRRAGLIVRERAS